MSSSPHQVVQHMNQCGENVMEMPSQTNVIANAPMPISNVPMATHAPDMDMMSNVHANTGQVIARPEPERVVEQNPPAVRKISRFQVSHVKEEEMKPTNIVHGTDALLENASPDQQKQAQVVHDMVQHNIISPTDNSPDKVESMVRLMKLF